MCGLVYPRGGFEVACDSVVVVTASLQAHLLGSHGKEESRPHKEFHRLQDDLVTRCSDTTGYLP